MLFFPPLSAFDFSWIFSGGFSGCQSCSFYAARQSRSTVMLFRACLLNRYHGGCN